MTTTLRRIVLVTGASAALVLAPVGAAMAVGQGDGPHGSQGTATCTHDQVPDRLQLHDGSGQRVSLPGGAAHQAGPLDGSGPQADRPLDGTGLQFGRTG